MRYAKALMAYAEERGAEERLYHELVTLAHSFRTVKGFCAVLDNPIVSVNEKFNLICTAADVLLSELLALAIIFTGRRNTSV